MRSNRSSQADFEIADCDLNQRHGPTPLAVCGKWRIEPIYEHQIVVAAELMFGSPDFGYLEPMVEAAKRELEQADHDATPEVVLADAGYWHQPQMERIVSRGSKVLIPPDAHNRKTAARATRCRGRMSRAQPPLAVLLPGA